MNRFFSISYQLAMVLIAAGLLFSLGCRGEGAPTALTAGPAAAQPPAQPPSEVTQGETPAPAEVQELKGTSETVPATVLTPLVAAQTISETGVKVSGQGQAAGQPDLAILRMGVESFAGSVGEARSEAATAMNEVLSALREEGIEDRDIQTRHFNVSPRYTSRDVTICLEDKTTPSSSGIPAECFPQREQVITGYEVSNGLTVRARNLESVDTIIDRAIAAGGDLIRFRGVSFAIEDTSALEEQARTAAVADMQGKAEQLASDTGVQLGSLIFIQESSHSRPWIVEEAASRAYDTLLSRAASSILPGQQTLTVTVQGVFAIQ